MDSVADFATPGRHADILMLLLPGACHGPRDFVEAGFVSAVRERGLSMDIVMAALEFEHVADASGIDRVYADILAPLRARYREIWLAGISIGGYVAMACAQRYAGLAHGLLLLAPYPGNRVTTNEIRAAGGLAAWSPAELAEDDIERRNWHWLKTHAGPPEIFLAYGEDDRFAGSHGMMAEALPRSHVLQVPGDHVWPVWGRLWDDFLDRRFGMPHQGDLQHG